LPRKRPQLAELFDTSDADANIRLLLNGGMDTQAPPSPDLFFDALVAYQKSAALKAGLDLNIFTLLADKPATAEEIASASRASSRGVRILCDYLTIHGFLSKAGDHYSLTRDSAVFLNRKSPAYAGGAAEFLLSDEITGAFHCLTQAVRQGGVAKSQHGSIAPEHPMWVTFARTMGGMMFPASQGLADLLASTGQPVKKILDVASGHGVWGISVAKKFTEAVLVALDWAAVLEVARENVQAAGIGNRFKTIVGSAFEVDLGTDYDLILIPNFLHHFNPAECVRFLRKAYAALRSGGRVAIVEFVPNPDRVTPPQPAGFSLVMLATTPEGDAYTFAQLAHMLADAGFQRPEIYPLPASVNQTIIAAK
jgi:ubiquinone/menaquinone biosynthesis C-methylase UbiE